MPSTSSNQINPKKLRLSKWTAVNPKEKEKHFLVTKVIDAERPKHARESHWKEVMLSRKFGYNKN